MPTVATPALIKAKPLVAPGRPLVTSDKPPTDKMTRRAFERDWLWQALRRIVDHTTHGGSKNNALMRSHVETCMRLIQQTNIQAIAAAWEEYNT